MRRRARPSRWRPLAVAGLALLALGAAPGTAPAATPQVSQHEIEGEVMCPVCGTLLELAEAPQAQRQKAFVAEMIEEGRSKEEIKDALVAEYGQEVLALPEGSGFSLSAYLVPIVAFVVAMIALGVGIYRWRRGASGDGGPSGGDATRARGPSREDAERLEADLSRYDL